MKSVCACLFPRGFCCLTAQPRSASTTSEPLRASRISNVGMFHCPAPHTQNHKITNHKTQNHQNHRYRPVMT